jgi:hypothetical protein
MILQGYLKKKTQWSLAVILTEYCSALFSRSTAGLDAVCKTQLADLIIKELGTSTSVSVRLKICVRLIQNGIVIKLKMLILQQI